jgi:hypothetical protein
VKVVDPPADLRDYVDFDEYRDKWRSQYVQGGAIVASSRLVPSKIEIPRVGTWGIDRHAGLHGHEIAVLRFVDPRDLAPSEHEPGRDADVERYRNWMVEEGRVPPPITVMETDRGSLKISDGHRRYRAALEAGLEIPAWVYPIAEHPERKRDAYGHVLMVGLTYEMIEPRRTR